MNNLQTPTLKGFVALYIGNDRNPHVSEEYVQMSPVYPDLSVLKEWHTLATGYLDLSRIPQEAIEVRK